MKKMSFNPVWTSLISMCPLFLVLLPYTTVKSLDLSSCWLLIGIASLLLHNPLLQLFFSRLNKPSSLGPWPYCFSVTYIWKEGAECTPRFLGSAGSVFWGPQARIYRPMGRLRQLQRVINTPNEKRKEFSNQGTHLHDPQVAGCCVAPRNCTARNIRSGLLSSHCL